MDITPRQLEIIDAAGKILTMSGVSGLTIKNLAKEMKFSESAIYRHFNSKEEIILVMHNYLAFSTNQRLSALTKDPDPEKNFVALFQEQFRFFSQNPHFVVAVFSDGLMEESQRTNETYLKLMNEKMKHLIPIIMEGQQKRVFTNAITSDEMMHIVLGTFKLQMFKWRIANFEFDIVRNGNNMVQSILTLIKTEKNEKSTSLTI
jgi:TetR/AcrR family fatty acid metabolism transcriptional regulator